MTIAKEDPNVFKWWQDMEEKYSVKQQPIFDVYRDMSITKLIELYKTIFTL